MNFHFARAEDLQNPDLGRFYKRNGHKGKILNNDLCFWLSKESQIIAAARVSTSAQTSTSVLRGVWVAKDLRGQGLATELLGRILSCKQFATEKLFCFSYPEALNLYRRAGFQQANKTNTPTELLDKQKHYQQRGTETTLLFFVS